MAGAKEVVERVGGLFAVVLCGLCEESLESGSCLCVDGVLREKVEDTNECKNGSVHEVTL